MVKRLSNSAVEAWFDCPTLYANRYEAGWTQVIEPSYFAFGTRMHELLRWHYLGQAEVQPPSSLAPQDELEAQSLLAAYQASYPSEPFEVIACEVPLDIQTAYYHLIGRADMLVRDKTSGRLQIMETKTESRGSKRNLPQAWTARHQGSYYVHAVSEMYRERVDTVILNVITRGTPGKQIGPTFRRDNLHRTPQQVMQALLDIKYVSQQVENLGSDPDNYPRATNHCLNERGWACDYYNKCHMESTDRLVQIAEPYSYLELK